ncbi:MAG: PP2C family protein-serine/threonine phosphatase [Desulfatibacillaceae bacterium]
MIADYYCAMDVGARSNQEDCLLTGSGTHQGDSVADNGTLEGDRLVFAVCDGLGGHSGGETASLFVSRLIAEHLNDPGLPPPDVSRALSAIQKKSNHAGLPDDSGTTVAGILCADGNVTAYNAGDSRVYRLDSEGITRVSHDHSLVQRMVDSGNMAPEDAFHSPYKNVVDFGLGPGFADRWDSIEIHVRTEAARTDAWYLMCSDGVHDVLRDEEIHATLMPDPVKNGPILMEAISKRGFQDNTSYVVMGIRG